MTGMAALEPTHVKACCALAYEHEAVRLLVGDTFHPGGLELTERLGTLLQIEGNTHLLDVASGAGTSALHLAETFGCRVTGIDYGSANVEAANRAADDRGFGERVRFQTGDAEVLPFEASTFDAVICECAFCLFPDKARAANEFARVLKPGGRLGLTDITRSGPLPPALNDLVAWVACIGDARPIHDYVEYLSAAGFNVDTTEDHGRALADLADQVRLRLLGADVLVGLGKLDLSAEDLSAAKAAANEAVAAIRKGLLRYALIVATL